MFSWLRSRRETELAAQLSEANAALESLKAANAGDLLAAAGSGSMLLGTSPQLSKAADQLSHFRGWTFACVHALASRIAGQAVRAGHRKATRPKAGKGWQPPGVESVDQHEVLTLLANPNDLQVGWSLWYFTVASLELTGRCLWLLDDGAVFPIPTSWMTGFVGKTRFEGFKVRPPGHVEETIIPAEEACYFFYPSPTDPRESACPLAAAGYPVAIDEAILKSQLSMFQRGIFPSHALVVGKNAGPDGTVSGGTRPALTGQQRNQLIRAVKQLYGGACKAGEPLILDGMIEQVIKLSNTATELDWTESGKAIKSRICQIFGVNPIILGELEGANRASSLAAEEHLAATINPKLRLLGETLTEYLGPRFGDVVIWFDQYTPKDFEAELKRMQLLAQYGAIELNELRAWAGLPPVGYGDMPAAISGGIDSAINDAISGKLAAIGADHVFSGGKNGHATLRN